jgi:NAD(P)-dependent dehydrogenase (short-subunit alcohol dehydrogenase family)
MLRRLLLGRKRQFKDMHGKRVWVIGASSGLGAALAAGLAAEGAEVALSARSGQTLDMLAKQMAGEGHIALPLDVTDLPSITRAVTKLRERWQRVDYLIYCAGIYEKPQWEPFSSSQQLHILDTNLGGVFRLIEAMLPWWDLQNKGHIALVSSITALGGAPHSLAYGASKAGLSHLAESLAIDLEPYNVQVQLITPGFMDTPMLDKIPRKLWMVMPAGKAAWAVRRRLGSERFEIHFPILFTIPAKLIRWLLPRSIYLSITKSAGK